MKLALSTSQTFYQDIGKSEHVLVMLHGWGGNWQSFAPLIPELSRNFRLIIPDLPVFAASQITNHKVWTSQDYVQWLNEFLETFKLGQFNLLGHSFGGKIAALFAASYPEKINKLILLAASGLPKPLSQKQLTQQKLLALIPTCLKAALPDRWRLKLLNHFSLATDHFNSSPAQKQILQRSVQENITESLQKITAKTLLVWGEQDQETPLEQGQQFAALIKHAQLSVVTGADHFVFLSHQQRVVREINQFIL